MDPANTNEALIEAELDVLEGADILMVKPALSYLDVIRRVKDNYNLPLALIMLVVNTLCLSQQLRMEY